MSIKELNIAQNQKNFNEISSRVLSKLNTPKLKLAIIGSELYDDKIKIKDFLYSISTTKRDVVTIYSGGRLAGADKFVKKYSIQFELEYLEFTPGFKSANIYSVHRNFGYNKEFSVKLIYSRNLAMIKHCDKLIIFWPKNTAFTPEFKNIISTAAKYNKSLICIN